MKGFNFKMKILNTQDLLIKVMRNTHYIWKKGKKC